MPHPLLRGLTDLFFPTNCMFCRQYAASTEAQPLCPDCLAKIPFNTPPFCAKCSRHLNTVSAEALCPDCQKQPPLFDEAWIITRYQPPMSELIQSFKFHNKTALRKTFQLIIKQFLDRYQIPLKASCFIPIPIHAVRLRERGYNQAELLADVLSEITGIPVRKNLLLRACHTIPQKNLHRKERWTNVQGAFRISDHQSCLNQSFCLVDDLLTTGATASEASGTLKTNGAAHVSLLALAAA